MTCAQVFSYALLLKGAGRTEKILALLDEGKLEEVRASMQALSGTMPAEVRQLWHEQRKTEERARKQAIQQRFGAEEGQLHPALAEWLAQRR